MPDGHLRVNKLRRLMGGMFGRCAWCGDDIAIRQLVEERFEVVTVSARHIAFLRDGEPVSMKLATVDHVVAKRDGGNNHIENLLPACADCNGNRTAEGKTRLTCRHCGGPKKNGRRRSCEECHRRHVEIYKQRQAAALVVGTEDETT